MGKGEIALHELIVFSELKEFADDNFKFDENDKVHQMGRKHWGKEKFIVTSNFSFFHSVFKRLVPQTRKNKGLFRKGLRCSLLCDAWPVIMDYGDLFNPFLLECGSKIILHWDFCINASTTTTRASAAGAKPTTTHQ